MTILLDVLALSAIMLSPPRQEDPSRQTRELVERLRSDSIDERAEATRRLKGLGKAAAAELEKAAKDRDPEVAALAQQLLRRLTLLETLPNRIQEAFPGVADRLAFGGDHAWTEVFLESARKRSAIPRIPAFKRVELEPLVATAIRGAVSQKEKIGVCGVVSSRRLRSAAMEIERLIEDEDLEVRYGALWALGKEPSKEVVLRIRSFVQHPRSDLRIFAAEALGTLRVMEATPEIVRLTLDAQEEVRKTAAWALGRMEARESVGAVRKLLKDDSRAVRATAIETLDELDAMEMWPEIAGLLKDPDYGVRKTALSRIGRMGSAEATPHVAVFLGDPEAELRELALEALQDLRARDRVPEILKLLEDETNFVRWKAIRALEEFGAREGAIRESIRLLAHKDGGIRATALITLGRFRAREAAPAILKLIKDEEPYVRAQAAFALGHVGAQQAVPDLIRLLKAEGENERWEAAAALGEMGAREAIPGLVEGLKDSSADVRRYAIESLARLGARETAHEVAKLLGDPDRLVRGAVVRSLARLDSQAKAVPLLLPLLQDPEDYVCEMALRALDDLDAWDKIPEVASLLEAEDHASIRHGAASWLCRAGSRQGVAILLEDEAADLTSLNALREPEVWKRLRRRPAPRKVEGTTIQILEILSKEAGLRFEGPTAAPGKTDPELTRKEWTWEPDDPTFVIPALRRVLPNQYSFILEGDRVRILPRAQAFESWRAWWARSGGDSRR